MKIALVAPLEESVPPKAYGGTELVVYNLCEELVRRGHQVTLLASGDSKTSAKLVPIVPDSLRSVAGSDFDKYRDKYKWLAAGKMMDVLEDGDFDIIHNHIGWRLLPFSRHFGHKMVTTMHGPLNVADQQIVFGPFPESNYISISLNQRKGMPHLNFVGNAYNGIEVEKFTEGKGDGGYLAFLGRISPEKGTVNAIKIAKAAGKKLRLAAKVDSVDKEYFEREVKPLIDGEQIQFIGEVNHEQKVAFLGAASALVVPIAWEEPFGLVNIEAFACGTPVIGLKRGSLPEIITDGKDGYLCEDVDEMIRRVGDIDKIDRSACRERAVSTFSAQHMAESYLDIYKKVAAKKA